MAEVAISLDGLGHAYEAERWVFRHYSASFAKGSIAALLGPNGRGKTTLLKILIGAARPTEGRAHVGGEIAFVPQLFETSFGYTALDLVLMGRVRNINLFSQPSRADADIALAALDRFGLADLAFRSFHQMSGGQRQLVIFARALVAQAEILILDEPTSALDLRNQALVLDWISKLSRTDGLTIVFTTHHPHHALAVADDVLLMMGETEYLAGHSADVLTEANLSSLYGVPLKRVTFEHGGRQIETLAPVLSQIRRNTSTG